MKGINKVILIGNTGKDPEFKTLQDGTPVAKLTIATTESSPATRSKFKL